MQNIRIIRIKDGEREIIEDLIIEEIPLKLVTGDETFAVLDCLPVELEDLVMGYLFTSGLINHPEDIERITIDPAICTAYIDWSVEPDCRLSDHPEPKTLGPDVESDLRFDSRQAGRWLSDFKKKSHIYNKTGGAHGAAIAGDDGIIIFREDISRYNAVDKVVGRFIMDGLTFKNKVLITSGRISSKMITKTLRCGINAVISPGAPTDRSVYIARENKITLIGFARGNRMNIYSGGEWLNKD